MNILLTGATGFVGSHILPMLLESGHSVCVTIRNVSHLNHIESLVKQCVVCNIDTTSIEQIYKRNKIHCVIHCATFYGRADTEYLENVESNLLFPMRLLVAGIEQGVRYFINTDTFFTKQLKEPGDCSRQFYMHGYTLSKWQFAQWGRILAQSKGIVFVNMLLEHVWGDGDKKDKFIPFVTEKCQNTTAVIKLSTGMQRRDFIHVSDVVTAYKVVLENLYKLSSNAFVEYGVGSGRTRTLREFTEIIYKAVHGTALLEWGAIPMRTGEIMESCADNTELIKIGWEPRIVSNESINKIILVGGI